MATLQAVQMNTDPRALHPRCADVFNMLLLLTEGIGQSILCCLQLYLALSAVLASGGQQPLTALQEADAELAALLPDTSKSKVQVLRCMTTRALLPSLSMTHDALLQHGHEAWNRI